MEHNHAYFSANTMEEDLCIRGPRLLKNFFSASCFLYTPLSNRISAIILEMNSALVEKGPADSIIQKCISWPDRAFKEYFICHLPGAPVYRPHALHGCDPRNFLYKVQNIPSTEHSHIRCIKCAPAWPHTGYFESSLRPGGGGVIHYKSQRFYIFILCDCCLCFRSYICIIDR